MGKLTVDTGTLGNPATGDSLRTAFNKVNTNFDEIYEVVGDPDTGLLTTAVTNGDIKVQPNGTGIVEIDSLQITDDDITSLLTNGTVAITGNGTGTVDVEGLSFKGTSISSGDSSTINLNENVNVDGNLTVTGNFDLEGLAVGTLDVDNLNLNDNTISSDSNSDINISPGGTGNVVFPGITVADNTITTSGSNANLELDAAGTGTVKVIGNLTLDDSDEIKLGDAGDLRIFHNGSHSIIREDGTGSLYLQSDNNVILGKDTSTETMVKGIADGAVELYHNNVKKLETSSSGVTVVDELHTEGATPHLTLKRTDNANVPTLRFKGSGGTIGASMDFQGTGGTSNELAFQVFDGSSIAERFRVTYTGAKVSGTLNIDDGVTITDNTIATSASNANLELSAAGTGNIILDTDLVSVGGGSEVGHISSNGAFNLLLSTNGDTDSGSIEIVDGANGNITIENNGTGDILLKAGGQVGIGSVSSPDTSLHVKTAAAKVTLQRTADANTPGLSFQNSNGNVRAELMMDGTSGTSNTVFVKTYDGSSLAERFRVTHTGATVTGTLDIDSGISITDNTITTSASNANLEINASGSGTVVLENLKIGTGSTVTTILDEDAMGSDSATALATQQSIKAYVDSTVTAQDLDFQGDSGGALNIDLDSETLDIAGGTNINTAGSGNTLTVNLDTALTGLTSVVVDNVTIADNSITTNASNANLELSANGSGIVTIDGGIDIGDINISYGTATTTSSSAANMDTFAAATFRSAKYQVSIVDSTNTRFGIYEIFVTHDGSSAYINAVGISDTGEDLATFSADIDSGSVRVRVVPVSDASTVFKFVRTVFAV